MIIVLHVWSFSGPPGRFRATIRKDQKWLLSESTIYILHSLLTAQRKSQEAQKTFTSFFLKIAFFSLPGGLTAKYLK